MSTDRVGGSGIVRRHKATHATGGTDALTPADIGAAASSDVIANSLFANKGTIAAASAASTPAALSAGSNGQMLMADSSATAGLRYVDPPANRNRLINGGMILDQRNAGGSLTPTAGGQYCLDRWANNISAGSKYSVQRSTTAPAGFTNSMLITSLAATSPGASDIYEVYNVIEGYDVRDLGFGAAGASTITLSFWVRSSLTGTFCGRIANTGTTASPNRTWVFEYSVAVADTWERKTVTITGDTAGTWNKTDGAGLRVGFTLGAGTNYDGTAGAWSGTNRAMTTSGIDLVATNGATLYLTGVQLETGPVATPFEFEPFEATLRKCQRYYQRITDATSGNDLAGFGVCISATQILSPFPMHVPMRVAPTAVEYAEVRGSDMVSTVADDMILSLQSANPAFTTLLAVKTGSAFTTHRPAVLRTDPTGNGYIALTAEL